MSRPKARRVASVESLIKALIFKTIFLDLDIEELTLTEISSGL
ncbi:MAG: hypothetical protein Q8J64_00610 [Thermodesulfovibrionales bacterium]|nr:hypothetical protein [Thermodesulfovibrionales bacterium]